MEYTIFGPTHIASWPTPSCMSLFAQRSKTRNSSMLSTAPSKQTHQVMALIALPRAPMVGSSSPAYPGLRLVREASERLTGVRYDFAAMTCRRNESRGSRRSRRFRVPFRWVKRSPASHPPFPNRGPSEVVKYFNKLVLFSGHFRDDPYPYRVYASSLWILCCES